ncbi:DUF3325 domain-containing protein [Pseudoalteromonas sp. B530]|uniref:DUF3325 domain-containing protein n=1 Tax=Pseudoalteromonas sp. B530 TaxID=2994390 RepID=UPI003A598822
MKLIVVLFVLLFLAFALLNLSLSRHRVKLSNRDGSFDVGQQRQFRILGYLLLFITVAFATAMWGVSLGLVYWFATATLTSILVVLLWTYKPKFFSFLNRC